MLASTHRIVGVDVGGTFTDFMLVDGDRLRTHKVLSTPDDPSRAVIQGLREMDVLNDAPVAHGSTVATNALLERRGARTALVTTAGFEDVLLIGRQARPSLYDLLQEKPEPLVPPELAFGVAERLDKDGGVVLPMTPQEAEAVVRRLQQMGAEAVSVSLLFSFRNPSHEEHLAALLEALPSRPFISLSSRVLPEFREYERASTVTVNAYVGPLMGRYLGRLEAGVGQRSLRVMQSSGGSISARKAAEQPVRTILSGPAGGVVGASWVAGQAGHSHIITFDMGGTSTDVSLCPGRIQETTSALVEGLPVSVPMIDIHTVGAGGGSIAQMDAGGALRVGPQSAGADPGPACYGKGDAPTVTDANLVLGRLVAHHFLGGRMALDPGRARRALEPLAQALRTDATGAALGIIRVVNSNMERAIRAVSLERGHDPRGFTLLAFGGAGAMHACELAQELGIPRVLAPRYPGILSALGVAIADVVKDYARTVMLTSDDLTAHALDEAFRPLEAQAREDLAREGYPEERWRLERLLDARYTGQSYELTVPCPSTAADGFSQEFAVAFHEAHQQRFGHSDATQGVEVVNVRLKAVARGDRPAMAPREMARDTAVEPLFRAPAFFFSGRYADTPVYARESLTPGKRIQGPSVVVQMDATTVLPPGWVAVVDGWGNLVAESTERKA
ncbi:MAG: hydantoinase/oxoprolinase family protein [Chloroflexi bacterium]|nr:hydantoinase/oxoprolinase family protein [Chloroflexota bacterium]